MRKWIKVNFREWNSQNQKRIKGSLLVISVAAFFAGCGGTGTASGVDSAEEAATEQKTEEDEVFLSMDSEADKTEETLGIAGETAKDAEIDFNVLQGENPEIFGWLYIPDTSIDAPILQSAEGDEYYRTHNAMKELDEGGALFIEAANLSSMCDFNTVIHGRTSEDGESGLFADLYQFADPDFFDSHERMYVYLDDNVLTYEIFAAYERENTSLLRTYDFTYIAGCDQFLEDLYSIRDMSMMIRTGWDEVTPYHFLVTLTSTKGDDADRQFVVLAALIDDPAGKIDRAVLE